MVRVIVIPTDEVINEHKYKYIVQQYFHELGYGIHGGNCWTNNPKNNDRIAPIHGRTLVKRMVHKKWYGIPDLWIFYREIQFLVEIKSRRGMLFKHQIEWMKKNGHLIDIYVAVPNENSSVFNQLQKEGLLEPTLPIERIERKRRVSVSKSQSPEG